MAKIKKENRIELVPGASQSGARETFDYSLAYQYEYTSETPQSPGKFRIMGQAARRRGLDSLTIWVNFVDAQGKVMSQAIIYNSGYRSYSGSNRFDVSVKTPPGTQWFAFTSLGRERRGKK